MASWHCYLINTDLWFLIQEFLHPARIIWSLSTFYLINIEI